MKAFPLAIVGSVLLAIFSASTAEAQVVVPSTAKKFERRGTGSGGGTGATVGLEKKDPAQQAQTVTIVYTAVSKSREWTNTDGKPLIAQLLAFSAPDPGKIGPVEVIKDGKVRFLVSSNKKPVDYPLEKLSQPDQILVKAIAQAASKGAPNPGVEEKEGAEAGGKE